jgi:hypothetical protein
LITSILDDHIHMKELIEKIERDWSTAKSIVVNGEKTDFRFICELSEGYNKKIEGIPEALKEFYIQTNGAILFKDIDYGQWGLKIVPFEELSEFNTYSKSWRGEDLKNTDLVIGEFLGDLDLLILSLAELDYGMVIICTPIGPRVNWLKLNMNFENFLVKYIEQEGNKFWEG